MYLTIFWVAKIKLKQNNLKRNKKIKIKEICEICGEDMNENPFAYDYDSEIKLIFKCPYAAIEKLEIYKSSHKNITGNKISSYINDIEY